MGTRARAVVMKRWVMATLTGDGRVDGVHRCSAALQAHLRDSGVDVRRYEVLRSHHNARFHRVIRRVAIELWLGAKIRGDASSRPIVVYRTLAGGHGVVFDLIFVLSCRIALLGKDAQLVVHHHSSQYVHTAKLSRRLLFRVAGRSCLHLVLSAKMASRLAELYSVRDDRTLVLGNEFAVAPVPAIDGGARTAPIRALFVGNLSAEKGVLRAIQVAAECAGELQLRVVGHSSDQSFVEKVTRTSQDVTDRGGVVELLGRLEGKALDEQYRWADILLFPSAYVNEASPLVVLEALAAGVQPFCLEHGFIPEQLAPFGLHAHKDMKSLSEAVRSTDLCGLEARSSELRSGFSTRRNEALAALSQLVERLDSSRCSHPQPASSGVRE